MKQKKLTIVFPSLENGFYQDLARRIGAACEEISRPVELRAAQEIDLLTQESLKERVLLLAMPSECLGAVDNSGRFLSSVARAKKRILLLAEAVEDEGCRVQFDLPVEYDAFVDVGFEPQEEKAADFSVPYHLLLNGPTKPERRVLKSKFSGEKRNIPWTLVGNMVRERAQLLADLVERVDPGGFVFMPKSHVPGRKILLENDHWRISPSALSKVLRNTRYYVWCSRPGVEHYESFRFTDALLAGAVPCKIGGENFRKAPSIPCIFSSVEDFGERIENAGFDRMFADARDFYLSCGLLSENLERILDDVV